ncbi:MAG: hypothetical protein FWE03_05970 [Firmicutes bacterium]|nr:hypothetical protein [Bacillota bacterium]
MYQVKLKNHFRLVAGCYFYCDSIYFACTIGGQDEDNYDNGENGYYDNGGKQTPSNLTAFIGFDYKTLYDVELPNGWRWVNSKTQLNTMGVFDFEAEVYYDSEWTQYDLSVEIIGFVYANTTGNFGVALDSQGKVWTWGIWGTSHFGSGWLGHGGPSQTEYFLRRIQGLYDITAISTGSRHVMALDKDGNVWTWGHDLNGSLGHGNLSNQIVSCPYMIEYVDGFNNIIAISAGGSLSVALDYYGNIWTWGDDWSGQTGHGHQIFLTTAEWYPRRLEVCINQSNLPRFVSISSGYRCIRVYLGMGRRG